MNKTVFVLLLSICFLQINAQSKWTYIQTTNSSNQVVRGILTDDGKELIKPIYQMVLFTDNIFYCKINDKWGCIDSTGKILIKPKYQDVGLGVSENLIRVKLNNKWGFINLKGKTVIKFEYDFACNFLNKKAYVIQNGKSFFISTEGKEVEITNKKRSECPEDSETAEEIPSQFEVDKSITIKQSNNKYGIMDTTGKIIIPIEFDEIGDYYNDVITVRKGELWGAYKNNGELIAEPKYRRIGLFFPWKN